jgi:hypothetical protein
MRASIQPLGNIPVSRLPEMVMQGGGGPREPYLASLGIQPVERKTLRYAGV